MPVTGSLTRHYLDHINTSSDAPAVSNREAIPNIPDKLHQIPSECKPEAVSTPSLRPPPLSNAPELSGRSSTIILFLTIVILHTMTITKSGFYTVMPIHTSNEIIFPTSSDSND
mmetsp:Transcript_18051/g.22738  ORF Transcript_18051/g.22738 Transcript_18051/m.22738 type:complete len:114 (+) Transcript_18051:165-506(+)